MAYPAPPWHLCGRALLALHLVDLAIARRFVPAELEPVTVLPGKTLGGIYLAHYTPGSTLSYSELIAVPALVRHGNSLGAWISHIYVDDADSVAGGREIWGLPKTLASFDWEQEFVSVSQGGEQLCIAHYHQPWLGLPSLIRPQIPSRIFSGLGEQLLQFASEFQGKLSLTQSRLSVPENSPLAALELERPVATAYSDSFQFIAHKPQVIGNKRSAVLSYF
ncbi:MAG: acetoacetate decarboxylase family protein [Spirulinaceae cyanobacterium RM2_2_10]|nr:acetoacetate decarboxylase family protein [Spirulinaceae cyanobacterium SM2_1_0]NJO20551.1 acetoacetate decarboxylase family protein [Spirulinaceae cyanobacterium RM2_2_10]